MFLSGGVPIVAHWVKNIPSLCEGAGLAQWVKDLVLLWLRHRPAAPIQSLAGKLPYASGVSLKRKKKMFFFGHIWEEQGGNRVLILYAGAISGPRDLGWRTTIEANLPMNVDQRLTQRKGLVQGCYELESTAFPTLFPLTFQTPDLHTRIHAESVTYTTAHGNTRSLIHWARSGIEPESSWMLVRFVSTELQWELQLLCFCLSVNPSSPSSWLPRVLKTKELWGSFKSWGNRGQSLWWLRQRNGSGGGGIFLDETTLGVLCFPTIMLWHKTTLCLVLRSAERYIKCLNMPSLETYAIYCQLGKQIPSEHMHGLWFSPRAME